MKSVISRVPLRVSFAGGGTDVEPFVSQHGGIVVTSTIRNYVYARVWETRNSFVEIHSIDTGQFFSVDNSTLQHNLEDNLLKSCLSFIDSDSLKNFSFSVRSPVPPGTGLGASSAIIISILAALDSFFNLSISKFELAKNAYFVEREKLKISGGLQDQYACSLGGFNTLIFNPDSSVSHQALSISSNFIAELEHNAILLWTGSTRQGDQIIKDQQSRIATRDGFENLIKQYNIAKEMNIAFEQEDIILIGKLLDDAWQNKKKYSPKISNSFIDTAYEELISAGALGGKLLGAGGGGFILMLCLGNSRHKVAEVAKTLGLIEYPLSFESDGVRVWSPNAKHE